MVGDRTERHLRRMVMTGSAGVVAAVALAFSWRARERERTEHRGAIDEAIAEGREAARAALAESLTNPPSV